MLQKQFMQTQYPQWNRSHTGTKTIIKTPSSFQFHQCIKLLIISHLQCIEYSIDFKWGPYGYICINEFMTSYERKESVYTLKYIKFSNKIL